MFDNHETTAEICAEMGNAFDAFEDAISEQHPDAVQSAAEDAMRQAIGWED